MLSCCTNCSTSSVPPASNYFTLNSVFLFPRSQKKKEKRKPTKKTPKPHSPTGLWELDIRWKKNSMAPRSCSTWGAAAHRNDFSTSYHPFSDSWRLHFTAAELPVPVAPHPIARLPASLGSTGCGVRESLLRAVLPGAVSGGAGSARSQGYLCPNTVGAPSPPRAPAQKQWWGLGITVGTKVPLAKSDPRLRYSCLGNTCWFKQELKVSPFAPPTFLFLYISGWEGKQILGITPTTKP